RLPIRHLSSGKKLSPSSRHSQIFDQIPLADSPFPIVVQDGFFKSNKILIEYLIPASCSVQEVDQPPTPTVVQGQTFNIYLRKRLFLKDVSVSPIKIQGTVKIP